MYEYDCSIPLYMLVDVRCRLCEWETNIDLEITAAQTILITYLGHPSAYM